MDISIVDNVHGDGLFVKHFQAHFMNVYSCAAKESPCQGSHLYGGGTLAGT